MKPKTFFSRSARAFTLVELLAVIAIIAILGAVALPAYNNYSVKSKFSEVVLATAPTKTAVSTCAVSGDCISGGVISLAAAGSGANVPGLYLPSGATNWPGTPNAYPVMYALQMAYAAYHNTPITPAQAASYTNGDLGAGDYVTVDPANPTFACIILGYGGGCYPGTDTPLSLFNQFYAPNAALIAAANASAANLPCVGGTGCSPATKYAASVSYDSTGVITATAQVTSGLNAETFILTPSYSGGRVDWAASGSCKTRAGGALC